MGTQFAKRKKVIFHCALDRDSKGLSNIDPDRNTRPTTALTQFRQPLGNNLSAVIIKAETIDYRILFGITKNARTRIARLRLRCHGSDFDKRKSQSLPRRQRHTVLVQTGCKPAPMPEIQSERRHPSSLGSRSRTQPSRDAQARERELMRGFRIKRKEQRAKQTLVDHLLRIIRCIDSFGHFRCKSFADAKLAEDDVADRFFVAAAEQFFDGALRFMQIDRKHFWCRRSVDRSCRTRNGLRRATQFFAVTGIDRDRTLRAYLCSTDPPVNFI